MNRPHSSSTEDLIMLFEAEKNLVKYLKSSYETNLKSNEIRKIIDLYLETIDFDDEEEVKQYVKHPVNSFHLLHRHNRAKVIIKLMCIPCHFDRALNDKFSGKF